MLGYLPPVGKIAPTWSTPAPPHTRALPHKDALAWPTHLPLPEPDLMLN